MGAWGWGGGSLCTAVYIQGCSLVPAWASVCVTLPIPVPCMTCDAADTTVLCRGVGAQRGSPPALCTLHPVTHVLGCRK